MAAVSARLSDQPRMTAISFAVGVREGSGNCTFLPSNSGFPGPKATCTSLSCAMARTANASTRLNGSTGLSFFGGAIAVFSCGKGPKVPTRARQDQPAELPQGSQADALQ